MSNLRVDRGPGRISTERMVTACFILCGVLLLGTGCRNSDVIPERVVGRNGMVVSANRLASEIGVRVLENGGNAVDAAVAVGFALAVAYPEAGNIGGGGFMVVRKPDGSSACVDFREVAPRASTPTMYVGNEEASVDGPLSAGVPGTVDGLLTALEKYGHTNLSLLIQPSIDLALQGFPVDSNLSLNLRDYRDLLARYPSTRRIFFRGEDPLGVGDLLVQDDLGHTLERIRDGGREGFYRGTTARLIASMMETGGGVMDTGDLSAYGSVVRKTLMGRYREYEIISPDLPSSGGMCVIKALQMLEPFHLGETGFHSEQSLHLMTEALKRVFSMRATYLGDPGFVSVPEDALMDSHAGRTGRFAIDTFSAVPSDSLPGYPGIVREGTETTHFSVIDREGMAVAVTYTVNDLFGGKDVVEGAGFFLNDEMDDFVTIPGAPNIYGLVGGEENMVRSGKRPLSSMTPTIVVRNDHPLLILGARGGAMIISAVFQVILNMVEFGLPPERAVGEPRIHHQWEPDTLQYEQGAITPQIAAGLSARGHHLSEISSSIGKIEAIYIEPGTGLYVGVPDPREGGTAAGY